MMPPKPSPEIRVRFAPSPTGYLHVGGARTAIFNWLFARHTGGEFVLRIEDTDIERSTRESEASLLEDLEWLGLDWDEGPVKGGDHGPYRQSERLVLYRAAADELVAKGIAYPCFCPDELLNRKKEDAIRQKKSSHYDGTCRGLTPGQIEQKRALGLPEAVRFEVPAGKVEFEDLVRGPMALETVMVGDFVIIRSNGLPTYNFAAAYDDQHMSITHVLRGEEHLSNTLRQILIYRALGGEAPAFAHLPLILAEDRSKLSKRHGASSVGELRSRGYLPEAALNYLVLLGWSHPQEKELLTREEMIESFTIERINKSAAVFDPKKLGWINGQHIRALDTQDWVAQARGFLPQDITRLYNREQQDEILDLLRKNVEIMEDLGRLTDVFKDNFEYEVDAAEIVTREDSKRLLDVLRQELAVAGDWSPDVIKNAIKNVGKKTGSEGKDLFFPVRAAITGKLHGPDLARTAALKGKDSVVGLIDRALDEGR